MTIKLILPLTDRSAPVLERVSDFLYALLEQEEHVSLQCLLIGEIQETRGLQETKGPGETVGLQQAREQLAGLTKKRHKYSISYVMIPKNISYWSISRAVEKCLMADTAAFCIFYGSDLVNYIGATIGAK